MTSDLPTVSVLVPIYNEQEHIEKCLASILDGSYPSELIDVFAIDGRSTDRTREVVERLRTSYANLYLIDNPDRAKPHGLNRGVEASNSDLVVRIDAHAVYPVDYVERLAKLSKSTGAENVGGIRHTHIPASGSALSRSLAALVSSDFATGGATWRTEAEGIQEVETVFGGCFKRSVFETIGTFDLSLLRTQDREFNQRIIANGGKILLDPEIACTYFSRTGLREYAKWTFDGASWLAYSSALLPKRQFGWKNVVPSAFVCYLLLLVLRPRWRWIAAARWLPGLAYLTLASAESVRVAQKLRSIASFPATIFGIVVTHVSYGTGFVHGVARSILRRSQ